MPSTSKPIKALEVFISYARKDERYLKELLKHLSPLRLREVIRSWHDRDIDPGTPFSDEIDTHLNTAHIILLLISADFMASSYCLGKEVKRALERHEAGEARVIPIILRPVDWNEAPFGQLQALPRDARPVNRWNPPDEAYKDIARNIREVAAELGGKQTRELAKQMEAEAPAKEEEEQTRELAKQVQAEVTPKQEEEQKTVEIDGAPKQEDDLEAPTDTNRTPWQILWELFEKEFSAAVLEMMEKCAERALELHQEFIDSMVLFEALLKNPEGALVRAFKRVGARVEMINEIVKKMNEKGRLRVAAISSKEELGWSQSVLEILVYARHLARHSGRQLANDKDVLEAFVLRRESSAMRLLAALKIEPELLLEGAFLENGELDDKRFSRPARAILDNALRSAQKTRLVGSAQILAALVEVEGGLARRVLWMLDHDPDRYVQHHLDNVKVFEELPPPDTLKLSVCSSKSRRILNLAELFARSDDVLVGADYLFKAYWQCTKMTR